MKTRVCPKSLYDTVVQVFLETFKAAEGEEEGRTVSELARELLSLPDAENIRCFVVEDSGVVAGAVIFSPLVYEKISAFLLSPMAIVTNHQRKGLGQVLIRFAIQQLGVDHLFLTYGDIRFYSKVGFQRISPDEIQPPFDLSMPEGWLVASPSGAPLPTLCDKPTCAQPFQNPHVW